MKNPFKTYTEWRQQRKQLNVMFQNFLHHLKSNPAGQFWFRAGKEGQPLPNPNDPDALAKAPAIEPWVYIAANVLGKNLSAAPMIVEQQESEGGVAIWNRFDGGDLYDLTQKPNPHEPMDVLLWRTILSLIAGDCYLVHDRNARELYHLHSKYVKVRANRNELLGYVIERDGKTTELKPDEVIHLRMPSTEHEFYGASPIEPIKTTIMTNHWYRGWVKEFFKSGGIPSGVLSSDQDVSPTTAEETRKEWNKTHGGGIENTRNISILGSGLSYEMISPPLNDILSDSLTKMTREEILGVFGCPPVFAGVFEYANYANSKEQKQFLWENAILPLQRVVCGYLNVQLVPQYGERLRLAFDTSEIKALQEDETEKIKREVLAVRGGIRTQNEARIRLGDEPVDDPAADELRISAAVQPNSPDKPKDEDGLDEDVDDDLKTQATGYAAAFRAGSVADKTSWIPKLFDGEHERREAATRQTIQKIDRSVTNQIIDVQKAHIATVAGGSRTLVPVLRSFFDGQLDRVLSKMDDTGLNGRIPVAAMFRIIYELDQPFEGKDAGDDISVIFNVDIENQLLAEVTDPVIRQMIVQAAMAGAQEVGVSFSISNPVVEQMTAQFETVVKNINRHTYNDILKILRDGYNNQLTVSEIERKLRGKYAEYYKHRSLTIARTESNGIVNAGHTAAYKAGGVEFVQWKSAFLSTSRPHHMETHNKVARIGEAFLVGGDLLKFPGDPNGHVANRVNCHCRTTPYVKG